MKTTFDDFTRETPKYNKDYLMQNMPRHLEFGKLWSLAVDKATTNGKNSATFGTVTAIYNNLEKNQIEAKPNKDNPKYNYYKQILPTITWKSEKDKNMYKSILNQLKEKGEISQAQSDFMKKYKI